MFVERRKDNYDELQILAGDVRTRRRRTNMWTTTIIAGTMAATAAYIATVQNEVSELRTAKDIADDKVAELQPLVIGLKAERDAYRIYADAQIDLSKAQYIGDKIGDINIGPGPDNPPASGPVFANVIWLVEGSRRFPMAANDFLWVPDASMWVQLKNLQGEVTIFTDGNEMNQPGSTNADGTTNASQGDDYTLPIAIEGLNQGNASKLCVRWHSNSLRSGFRREIYGDIEILFQNGGDDCLGITETVAL